MTEIFNNCVTGRYVDRVRRIAKPKEFQHIWLNVYFQICDSHAFDFKLYNLSDFYPKIALAKACEAMANISQKSREHR